MKKLEKLMGNHAASKAIFRIASLDWEHRNLVILSVRTMDVG